MTQTDGKSFLKDLLVYSFLSIGDLSAKTEELSAGVDDSVELKFLTKRMRIITSYK